MATLRQKMMGAAVTGAFTVGANYLLKEFEKKDPTIDNYVDGHLGGGEAFLLGFSASMLQQYVYPML